MTVSGYPLARARSPAERLRTQWLLLAALAFLAAVFAFLASATTTGAGAAGYADLNRTVGLFETLIPHVVTWPTDRYYTAAWLAVGICWVAYLGLLWATRDRDDLSPGIVFAGGALLVLLAVLIPPVHSSDVFGYAMFGRISSFYAENPYLAAARDVAPRDPLLRYVDWPEIRTPYGPLWTLISHAVSAGRDPTPLDLAMRFKLLGGAAVLVDGLLIYRIVRSIAPRHAAWSYLAFAWNPVVLIEGVASAHNEAVILALVLAGAWCLATGRASAGIACVAASGLIKYSTAPLLAITALPVLRRSRGARRLQLAVQLVLVVALVSALAFAPYWAGAETFRSVAAEPSRGMNNPVVLGARELVALVSGFAIRPSGRMLAILGLVAFGAWQCGVLARRWRAPGAPSLDRMLADCGLSLTVFLALWPRIQPWYFLVPIGLALAAGPNHRGLVAAIFVITIAAYLPALP